MRRKKRNKKARIDEYYNDGIVELLRSGNVTSIKNVMDDSQAAFIMDAIIDNYDETVKRIDDIVKEVRLLIIRQDPLRLLKFCQQQFLMSNLGITSEHQLTHDRILSSRITEYVQSVIVSSESQYEKNEEYSETELFHIANLVEELYANINIFYTTWGASKFRECNDEHVDQLVESLLMFNVRGNRYSIMEEKYHRLLLGPHNETFQEVYGITSDDIVNGLSAMLYNLSQGTFDAANALAGQFESSEKEVADEKQIAELFLEIFSAKLNDVIETTGLPENFAKDLSYGVGEYKKFFNDEQFSGWPILNLPIHRRPFIEIEGGYYCFDYYSLADNFYRAVQHAITLHSDAEVWKEKQKLASEKSVGEIFHKLLPDAEIYIENYYPAGNTLKRMYENDLLILYSRILLIVEVKAGAFTYTSPLTDYESHIKSYKNLIESAAHQCERVGKYIDKETDTIIFYDENRNEKFKVKKEDVDKVFKMSVTVDNINAFAARAEKIGFLNLESKAICIGIDDLITYGEYFESPLFFMHFLKQRENATMVPNLQMFDELDHLGMYINYNCYPMLLNDVEKDSRVFFDGFREDLDSYFGQLIHPHKSPAKPKQDMPELLEDIITCIEKSDIPNKVWLSSYILDLDSEARLGLCEQIKLVSRKQKQKSKMLPIIASGDEFSLRYCVYLLQDEIDVFSEDEREEHLLSVLVHNEESDRVRIDLTIDENGIPVRIFGKEYYREDIPSDRVGYYLEIGKKNADIRVAIHKQKHGKIGRNELCPCGSGKKYKKCCGII